MNMKRVPAMMLFFSGVLLLASESMAQDGEILEPTESYPTILSIKIDGGLGIGRARENIGDNGTNPIWWSAGQGVKMNAAIDIPLLPIEVINPDPFEGEPDRFSVVGLEVEFASGYHISTGGTTSSGGQTTTRSYTYVPVTLGFNTRVAFGAGMPSVYIGAGGGLHLKAIYEENVSIANSGTHIKRSYDPPVPFELYGLMGLEIPLLYSPDDGNSMLDLYVQARLSEVTNYLYDFVATTTTPSSSSSVVGTTSRFDHPASNVAFTLGIKFNIY